MVQPNMSVKVDMGRFHDKNLRMKFRTGIALNKTVNRAGLFGVRTEKKQAPVGKTRPEFGYQGGSLRARIMMRQLTPLRVLVTPVVDYAKFVVGGTRASPGRFVPQLGKRLVNPKRGMHPGIKANDFVGRTRVKVQGEIPKIWAQEKAAASGDIMR